jgi:hypothetical protein
LIAIGGEAHPDGERGEGQENYQANETTCGRHPMRRKEEKGEEEKEKDEEEKEEKKEKEEKEEKEDKKEKRSRRPTRNFIGDLLDVGLLQLSLLQLLGNTIQGGLSWYLSNRHRD